MRSRGFTLWELMYTLSIAGLCLTIGAPTLRNVVLDSRRTADINAFVLAVQLARSESLTRDRPVIVCKTPDTLRCAGNELRYDAGWMVFVNGDDVRPPSRRPDEPLLLVHRPSAGARITSNRAYFEFRTYPRRSTNGTVTFCDTRGAASARAVIVSYTGRPRTSGRAADNGPLDCGD